MRGVSPTSSLGIVVLSLAAPVLCTQEIPGRPASASFAAPVQTIVRGHVFTSDGLPASGAEVVSSAGGWTRCRADGSFELGFELEDGATAVELTARLERDGSPGAARARVALERPRDVTEAGVLTLTDDCLPRWLPTFGGMPGPDRAPLTLEVFDDGSGPALYAGGYLAFAGGISARSIARWNGTRWTAVGDGTSGPVFVLRAFGASLYAGGNFSGMGGPAANVARWDGTTWSPLASGLNSAVFALAVFDDGDGEALYVGGDFTGGSGVSMSHIGKWDGTSWSALGSGVNDDVYGLEVFDDGSGPALYASGYFTRAGGQPANRIARWDGTSWSALGTGLDTAAWSLAVFDSGDGPELYAGGPFDQAGGLNTPHVARWNGSSWARVGSGVDSSVDCLRVMDDGSGPALYASGRFRAAGGAPASHVARWNGTTWSALGSGVRSDAYALEVFDDGSGAGPALYVGGDFGSAGDVSVSYIARWNGASWSALGGGLTGYVFCQAAFDNGSGAGPGLYAGGYFAVGGTSTSGIARWNGAQWSRLGAPPGPNLVSPLALAVFDDGSGAGPALFAGGSFEQSQGGPGNHIARWDGASWSPLGSGTNWIVRALAVFDDGSGPALYVGGSANAIRRWNAGGWSSFGSLGASAHVLALTVYDDGSGPALYVGGRFESAGGQPAANVARWDGSHWSRLASGTNDDVEALAVFDDGSGPALIAAGRFTNAGGTPANRIARWDGTSWSPLAGGVNDTVHALTVFDDLGPGGSALYVGGDFRQASGVVANRIARWDGLGWSPLGGGLSAPVYSLFVFDDPQRSAPTLVVGGWFASAFDSGDSYLALWRGWSCADDQAPVLTCPVSISVDDSGAPGEVVTFEVTATDELDPSPTVLCLPPSGSVFPPGQTLVTCKATDASGNQAVCTFPVLVRGALRRRM